MENIQLNTKQDLISSIAKIGSELTVNQFVDSAHGSFIDKDITQEDFVSIMNQALEYLQNTKTRA
jgi:SUMO ligase MMS21 Smc5/6 complex component